MINTNDILETIGMIQDESLDIRTITMGISLLDSADSDIDKSCQKIYDKICHKAEKLVSTGESIEKKYDIPIVNKRISVTPIAMLAGVSGGDPIKYARILDKAAKESARICPGIRLRRGVQSIPRRARRILRYHYCTIWQAFLS